VLHHAHALWDAPAAWDDRVRAFAVSRLLGLKNDAWLGDDESALTTAQFTARMTPQAVTLDPDGSFTFFYADGDLFWGHSILVSGTIADGPADADIAG
jgi:hypothetical protein